MFILNCDVVYKCSFFTIKAFIRILSPSKQKRSRYDIYSSSLFPAWDLLSTLAFGLHFSNDRPSIFEAESFEIL